MITLQRQRLLPPVQQQNGSTFIKQHGEAMPILHYRVGYQEPICNSTSKGPFRDTDACDSTYSPELNALKKVRNSGGTTRQTMSNAEYLKSRSKTYEQKNQHYVISTDDSKKNLYHAAGSGSKLDSNGNPINYCTTWKPNNLYYSQDGGVSNSTNINKIKYNAIQKHAKTMYDGFDKSVANAYAYSGRAEAPFTNKSKLQTAMVGMFRRKGNRQSCNVCK